jgi:hypothetical protein
VGRVYQILRGQQAGPRFWKVAVVRPGPRVTVPTNGIEARRGDASRRVRNFINRV